jgi:hypothetical protein
MIDRATFRLIILGLVLLSGAGVIGAVVLGVTNHEVPAELWALIASTTTAVTALPVHPPTRARGQ